MTQLALRSWLLAGLGGLILGSAIARGVMSAWALIPLAIAWGYITLRVARWTMGPRPAAPADPKGTG